MSFYFSLLTPKHKELPVYITGIGREEPQGYVDRDKGFPYYQFAYCTAGRGIFRIDGKEYIIEEGMLFYFEPDIPHEYHMLTEDFSTRWIIFMGNNIGAVMDNVSIGRRYDVVYLYNSSEFLHCLDIIEQLVEKNAPDSMVRASGLFYSCITGMRHGRGDGSDTGIVSKVGKAVEYIQNNYMRDISLQDIAQSVNVSESYLCRIFKKVYNMGPVNYLAYQRINIAKKMLIENRDYNISEISSKTGFQSVSYFGMVFKKYEGCTPKEFRNSFVQNE